MKSTEKPSRSPATLAEEPMKTEGMPTVLGGAFRFLKRTDVALLELA